MADHGAPGARRTLVYSLADLLMSGLIGMPLLKEMRARFGAVTREEAFLAIVLARTDLEVDLVLAEAEVFAHRKGQR